MSSSSLGVTPELVARIRAGDQAAFERLFRAWYGRLADYAAALLSSRDSAEDAVQDVFVAIWRRHDALPDAAKLPSYLHRAVRNRALNQIRSRRSAERYLGESGADLVVEPRAARGLEQADLAAALREALAGLSPRNREVFLLSREQGLTYSEIAETLGISIKTVETLMSRALRSLRDRLAPRMA